MGRYDSVISVRVSRKDKEFLRRHGPPSEIIRALIREWIRVMKKLQRRRATASRINPYHISRVDSVHWEVDWND